MIACQFWLSLTIQDFFPQPTGRTFAPLKRVCAINDSAELVIIFISVKITYLKLLLIDFFSLKEKYGAVSFALIYNSGCSMSFPSLMKQTLRCFYLVQSMYN